MLYIDNDFVIGPALIAPVRAEEKLAVHPRMLVPADLLDHETVRILGLVSLRDDVGVVRDTIAHLSAAGMIRDAAARRRVAKEVDAYLTATRSDGPLRQSRLQVQPPPSPPRELLHPTHGLLYCDRELPCRACQ